MLDYRTSALPILDSRERAVGILSKTDLVSSVSDDVRVALVMSSPVLTCVGDSLIRDAARTMRINRVHHLVVVDHEAQAVGMLSVFDLLEVFESALAR